ncbi:MDR family MFS transporter [Priestia taiwanensis]|uniref:MFS transporter n=1 Tax=Priestia taiwanensis TaxID=1347902 RepID=A0A917ETC2_9BACI|nr:MFS transporter [Priestia taiwanensis]MBM7363359.1 MFS family permease [Priestia taiwanensis]GGE77807.1 MFS transporter [Priestia taiwanensis]
MPKRIWLLIIGMIINMTGASFLWPFNTIYIHGHLEKSLSVAGMALMFNSIAGVIGNMLGGWLFDRIGGYKSILTGIVITLLSISGMVFYHEWPFYVVFLTLIGFGSGIVFPAMFAMVGDAWPEGGRKAFNALYVAQNVGVAIGSAAGGFVASFSFHYIFIANAVLYTVFFFIALFGFGSIQTKKKSDIADVKSISNGFTLTGPMKALLVVCIAYALCWFSYVQWQGALATHIQALDIDLKQYSLLWTINGALIVLAQPLVSMIVSRFTRSLKQQIIVGILILMVSFGVVSIAEQFTMFVVAMVILTIGEMFVWPAVPTIANNLAPEGRVGFYQGIVNSAATGGRMFGPLVGGAIVDNSNITMLFIFLFAVLTFALVMASLYDRVLQVDTVKEEEVFIQKGS